MKSYPKVIIIGHHFNQNNGAGVTLTNLFKDFPEENIAVASFRRPLLNTLTKKIRHFYVIGHKEIKVVWPLHFFHKPKKSEAIVFNGEILPLIQTTSNQSSLKSKWIQKATQWLGYSNHKYHFHLSNEFKNWIEEFNPDIIYSALGNLDLVNIIIKLKKETNRKIAIHLWDDWPHNLYKNNLQYFRLKILYKKTIPVLFDKADILLSISESMSDDYLTRYNKVFSPFHNPVDINLKPKDVASNGNINNAIIYIGKINKDTDIALLDIAQAIEKINDSGINIAFHIYTPSQNHTILNSIKKNSTQCANILS